MQLDYKILWIENETEFSEARKVQIESHILEKGFSPNIIIREEIIYDENENLSYKNNIENLDEYDIIFVDYNLDDDNFGDKFIKTIRSQNIYTNVVFYSSEIERVEAEMTKNREERLQGIYLYDRVQFNSDELFDLIDFFLEKDMNDNTMRGIVMSEVAKFDWQIWECLKCRQEHDYASKSVQNCQKFVADRIKNFREELYNNVKELDDASIWEMVNTDGTIVLDSMKRSHVLRKDVLGKSHSLRNELLAYENFLPKRNKLAHEINSPYNDSEYLAMRKDIIRFRKIFNDLCYELSNITEEKR